MATAKPFVSIAVVAFCAINFQLVKAALDLADVIDTRSIHFNDIIAQASLENSLKNCSSSMSLLESPNFPEISQGRTFKAGKYKLEKNPNDESIFLGRKVYNSSVLTFIPLVMFTLPSRSDFGDGSTIDLTNQAIFALFGLFVVVSQFLVPVLLTGTREPPGQSRSSKDLQLDFGNIFKFRELSTQTSVDEHSKKSGSSKMGLDRESCLKNIICEAYRKPEKYQWLGAPFRALFPLRNNKEPSQYEEAVRFGLNQFSEKKCQEQYKCLFDFLDLTTYFLEMLEFAQVHPRINVFDDQLSVEKIN